MSDVMKCDTCGFETTFPELHGPGRCDLGDETERQPTADDEGAKADTLAETLEGCSSVGEIRKVLDATPPPHGRLEVAALKSWFTTTMRAKHIAGARELFDAWVDEWIARKSRVKQQEIPIITEPPPLAIRPDILDDFGTAVHRTGLVGEEGLAKVILLAITSRLFDRPVNVIVKGPSAAGKSYTVDRVLQFVPANAYIDLTTMSELGLVYMEDEFSHKYVVLYEAFSISEDSIGAYVVRSLLSEGRIRHQTTIKQKGVLIEKEGPTGLITTTTKVTIHTENETRMFSVTVDDTREQTKRVLEQLARIAEGVVEEVDVGGWHNLQHWLAQGETRVVVPFASILADLVPKSAAGVRLRRDFSGVLCLIRAHALLHRATRDRDDQGRILATVADYATVREIVGPVVAEAMEATVSDKMRETVAAVAALEQKYPTGVPLKALADRLGLEKSTASRRWQAARDKGYLVNLEERDRQPAQLKVGDALPEEVSLLPDPALLNDARIASATARNSATVPGDTATEFGDATVDMPADQGEQATVALLQSPREATATVATPNSVAVLDALGELGPTTIPTLATTVGSDWANVRLALEGLEAEGTVWRYDDPDGNETWEVM